MPNQKDHFQFNPDPHQYALLDKSHLPTAHELFSSFPQSLLVVLDFPLQDQQSKDTFSFDRSQRFLATQYRQGSRKILNVDHHNPAASQTPLFSTTHQVISAVQEGILNPGGEDQIALVNHDDSDSVLALLLAIHGQVPAPIIELFAQAAEAADHTGEPNQLVNLIDAFYRTFDLPHLVPLINALMYDQELVFPNPETGQKFAEYEQQPEVIRKYLQDITSNRQSEHGGGFYDQASRILCLEPKNNSINTIRIFPITEQLSLPVSIIMMSSPLDAQKSRWKISLRAGNAFPQGMTLEQLAARLQLQTYGYGGRRDAGGLGRHTGGKDITPHQMFLLLSGALT